MAGIQVFFQAILNGNTIIRLFGLSKDDIFNLVNQYSITNISATPTFYRLLLPHEKQYFSVLKITSGGEQFDSKTLSNISAIFPNAKIYNIYASTEAGTLFAAKDNCFEINNNIVKYIKILDNELYIHNSLMGEYVDNSNCEWYATGDIVEIISTLPLQFVFKSRKSDMINVGGYKVNPNEVEDIIRSIDGIVDVMVYSKKNSVLGNIILCDVVTSDLLIRESTIRNFLKEKLQEYKIPRVIRFVNELEITRTGKIKRM
jgi:acyl-CoA synthetase (AMP-forming)/AMP-acid ligase II